MSFKEATKNFAFCGDSNCISLEVLTDKYIRDLKNVGYCVEFEESRIREELNKNSELACHLFELYKSAPGGFFTMDPSHLEVYENMESKGEMLDGDKLEHELYGNNLSGLEEEIKYLEERIKLEEEFHEDYAELELQLREQIKFEQKKLEQLDKLKIESQVRMMKVKDNCIKEFDNVLQEKCKLIEVFASIVSSFKKYHSMFVEGCTLDDSLEELKAEFDSYLSTLTRFKSEFLETPGNDNQGSKSSSNLKLLSSLQQINDSLVHNKHICMKLSIEERGLNAAIIIGNKLLESLKSGKFVLHENQIQNQIKEWEEIKTSKTLLQEFDKDLSSAAQIIAESYILPLLLAASQDKSSRLESWLSKARIVMKFIELPKNLSEVIPLILYLKQSKVVNYYDIINIFNQCVVQDGTEVSARMEVATDILHDTKDNEKRVLEPIYKSIDSNCHLIGDEDPYNANSQLVDKIESLNRNIIERQNLFLSSERIKHILLLNDIYVGIVMKNLTCPLSKDKKFESNLHRIEKELNKLEMENESKLQLLTEKSFLKHRRLLWVYILCNQEKLESVVADIQNSVPTVNQQETSKSDLWHHLLLP